jgi:hypothetical protein
VEAKSCPTFETLSRFADGALDEPSALGVALHLEGCDACLRTLTEATAADSALSLSLEPRAGAPCPLEVSASEEQFAHLADCARCRSRLRKPSTFRLVRSAAWAAAALLLAGVGYGLLRPTDSFLLPVEVDAQLSRRPDRLPASVAVALGDVGVDSSASPQLRRAVSSSALDSGDRVTTRGGQKVKLNLEGGGELLVNENSRLRVERAGVKLEEGELVALAPRPLQIETPSGTASLSSGELHVLSRADLTSISLLAGGGEFRGAERPIALTPDQELRVKGKSASKVRRELKRVDWAEPIRNVYAIDQFESADPAPFWRLSESASRADVDGRPVLSLIAHPRFRKRGAFAGTTGDFPLGRGVSFEIDLRAAPSAGAGRVLAWLQSRECGVAWSLAPGEESLDVHPDPRGRHARLWSSRKGELDGRWQRVKLVVTPQEVALFREGTLVARKPHGLSSLDRVSLVLGTQATGKQREPFECQIGRVAVQRETLE